MRLVLETGTAQNLVVIEGDLIVRGTQTERTTDNKVISDTVVTLNEGANNAENGDIGFYFNLLKVLLVINFWMG